MNTGKPKHKGQAVSGLVLSLTAGGDALGAQLLKTLPDTWRHMEGSAVKAAGGIYAVTAAEFAAVDALVFIGAAGIAVRAIAPHLKDKFSDPAVLVMDERGHHVISLLSGHVGGANELAVTLAEAVGAVPVITTATDVSEKAALDLILKALDIRVADYRDLCLEANRQLLDGAVISLWVDGAYMTDAAVEDALAGLCLNGIKRYSCAEWGAFAADETAGLKVSISYRESQVEAAAIEAHAQAVIPRPFVLGSGARKGLDTALYQQTLKDYLHLQNVSPLAIDLLASADLKKEEVCLLETAAVYGWKTQFYGADALKKVDGQFPKSEMVYKTLGLRAVSGPAALLAAGLTSAKQLYGLTYKLNGSTFTLGRISK